MPDLPSVNNFINSPPGQLVAGTALAGIVWKFFERVEGVVTDQTKHQIARWLRVRNIETGLVVERAEPWPETFAIVFDRVFGEKHVLRNAERLIAAFEVAGTVSLDAMTQHQILSASRSADQIGLDKARLVESMFQTRQLRSQNFE
jgi:hypothetical protein